MLKVHGGNTTVHPIRDKTEEVPMQTKTLQRLVNPVGAQASLATDDSIQRAKRLLRARRKRQRANRKAGRANG